jgi:transmembrane sensor
MPHGPPRADSTHPVDWETIARHLAGESAVDEEGVVRRWLDANPRDAHVVSELDRLLDRLPASRTKSVDIERALIRVRARQELPQVRPLRPRAPWSPGWRAAAAIALAVGGGFVWQRAGGGDQVAASAQRVTTGVGQRDSLRLPDGTRIVLAPASELVVRYERGERKVELRGEAYFDVRHDENRPFSIVAGATVVRDIGTTFSVRSEADSVRVVVTSGSVELSAGRTSVTLGPSDVGSVAGKRMIATRGAYDASDLAWMEGRLVFREAPVQSVIAEVRRWYGIDLRVSDPTLAERHLTASFAGEPPERVLNVIGLALGGTVERHGAMVIVRPATEERR